MNPIARLQADFAAAQAEAAVRIGMVHELRSHLGSGNFAGTDPDGSRRDWIAVADVQAWITRLLTTEA